jgi:acrylyl-CoA reductase (NADPH)
LAGGMDLPSSVAPFILRGVSLLGIDSVQLPMPRRKQAWERLARDLDVEALSKMTTTMPLSAVRNAAHDILAGKVRGRLVVEI